VTVPPTAGLEATLGSAETVFGVFERAGKTVQLI